MLLYRLKEILSDQPAYRYRQACEAVLQKLVSDWQEVSSLPQEIREKLNQEFPLALDYKIFNDGRTQKAVLSLVDGETIETVLINNFDGRNTICVSCQIGCPIGCGFCATGASGFVRNLTAGEIIDQVLLFARELHQKGERVDNVVFMGMGEPLLNLDNVLEAINLLNDKQGFNIGARSISVSTCGIPAGIRKIAAFPLQINLAISLHAATDSLRQELMPIAKEYRLTTLIAALNDYLSAKGRKLMVEYIMLRDVNDSATEADKLADLINLLPKNLVMVNLIPYNPTGKFVPSPPKVMEQFKQILGRRGIEATIRESLGGKILGACGQLARKR